MIPVDPAAIAGVTLTPPRLLYDADGAGWGSTTLVRPHVARGLAGARFLVRAPTGAKVATFDAKPFVTEAVPRYWPAPAVEWRALIVEHRLLSRPELIWTGTLPDGWAEGLPKDRAEALRVALVGLHLRYASFTDVASIDYTLRSLECVECAAARAAALPPGLSFWEQRQRQAKLTPCTHGKLALAAMQALTRAHPELAFEVLGWIEPAGARVAAEGPEPTRFALTGPLMGALLGPWLVGQERNEPPRTTFTDYVGARRGWGSPREARPPELPRWQRNPISLAASAWGFTASPEALVRGDPTAPAPALDRAGDPPLTAPLALPGDRARRRARKKR